MEVLSDRRDPGDCHGRTVYLTRLVVQSALNDLTVCGIHHCNLLKTRVKIISDHKQRLAPFLRALVDPPLPSLPGCGEFSCPEATPNRFPQRPRQNR
jgi:hypothetical protein